MNQHKESKHAAQSCRKQDKSGLSVSTVSAAVTCPGSLPGTSRSPGSVRGCRDHPETHRTGQALCNCKCKTPGKSPTELPQARPGRTRHGQEGQALAGCRRTASPSSGTAAHECFPANFLHPCRSPPHAKKPHRHHIAEHQLHLPLAIGTLHSQLHIWDTSVQDTSAGLVMPRHDCPTTGTAQARPALPIREGPVPQLLPHTPLRHIPKPLCSRPPHAALAGCSQLLHSPGDFESS